MRAAARSLASLPAILALAGGVWAAPAAAATVEGVVLDRRDNPVPGVRVIFMETGGGTRHGTYTNRRGWYILHDLDPGTYVVTVRWGRDLVYRRRHRIDGGTLDIKL